MEAQLLIYSSLEKKEQAHHLIRSRQKSSALLYSKSRRLALTINLLIICSQKPLPQKSFQFLRILKILQLQPKIQNMRKCNFKKMNVSKLYFLDYVCFEKSLIKLLINFISYFTLIYRYRIGPINNDNKLPNRSGKGLY